MLCFNTNCFFNKLRTSPSDRFDCPSYQTCEAFIGKPVHIEPNHKTFSEFKPALFDWQMSYHGKTV